MRVILSTMLLVFVSTLAFAEATEFKVCKVKEVYVQSLGFSHSILNCDGKDYKVFIKDAPIASTLLTAKVSNLSFELQAEVMNGGFVDPFVLRFK